MTVSASFRRAPTALAVLLLFALQALAPTEAQYIGPYSRGSTGSTTRLLRNSRTRAGGRYSSGRARGVGGARGRRGPRGLLATDDVLIPGTVPKLTPHPRARTLTSQRTRTCCGR